MAPAQLLMRGNILFLPCRLRNGLTVMIYLQKNFTVPGKEQGTQNGTMAEKVALGQKRWPDR